MHHRVLISVFVPAEAFSAVLYGKIQRPATNFCKRDEYKIHSTSSIPTTREYNLFNYSCYRIKIIALAARVYEAKEMHMHEILLKLNNFRLHDEEFLSHKDENHTNSGTASLQAFQ